MREFVHQLKEQVLNGYSITREDAEKLLNLSIEKEEDLHELLKAANEIRE